MKMTIFPHIPTFLSMFELLPVEVDVAEVQDWGQQLVDGLPLLGGEAQHLHGALHARVVLAVVLAVDGARSSLKVQGEKLMNWLLYESGIDHSVDLFLG